VDVVARCFRPKIGAHERGAEAVEFALVVPFMMLLVFGGIDFGYMINLDTMVNNASREGAREGSLNPDQADIIDQVRQSLATVEPLGTSPSNITVLVTCRRPGDVTPCTFPTDAAQGGTVIVKVDYTYSWITFVGGQVTGQSDIALSKTTEMRIE